MENRILNWLAWCLARSRSHRGYTVLMADYDDEVHDYDEKDDDEDVDDDDDDDVQDDYVDHRQNSTMPANDYCCR